MITTILMYAGIAALCGVVGYVLFSWDARVEKRRRGFIRVARTLREYGLVRIPEFLETYAVGDYSGALDQLNDLATLFESSNESVTKEFDHVFERVLTRKLATPEGRAYVAAKLQDAGSPSPVS